MFLELWKLFLDLLELNFLEVFLAPFLLAGLLSNMFVKTKKREIWRILALTYSSMEWSSCLSSAFLLMLSGLMEWFCFFLSPIALFLTCSLCVLSCDFKLLLRVKSKAFQLKINSLVDFL